MIVGYARVSTDGQTLGAQQAALRQARCERVFGEKVSGAKTVRHRSTAERVNKPNSSQPDRLSGRFAESRRCPLTPESGHRSARWECPLCAKSGREQPQQSR